MEKTIEQVGVGGLVLTADGNTVRLTKIEPNPIVETTDGRSVLVHYVRTDDETMTGEMMLGTKTVVSVPA